MNELEEEISKQQTSLASELIKELKAQNKRSHIREIILAVSLVIVTVCFIWYISLPIEETTTTTTTQEYTQDSEGNGTNNLIGNNGDINNGKTEAN